MKTRSRTPRTAIHPAPLHSDLPRRSPRRQTTFEGRLESLVSDFGSKYDSNFTVSNTKRGQGTECTRQEASFSQLSSFSQHCPTDRTMKESKRLFTKCISEMNSGKKLTSQDSPLEVPLEGSSNTLKVLKIQMIESVVPEDRPAGKRMPFMELKRAASALDFQP